MYVYVCMYVLGVCKSTIQKIIRQKESVLCTSMASPSLSLLPHNYKVDHVRVSTLVANAPPATNFHNIVRNSRSRGYYLLMKAKVTSETDVLAQDSVGVAAIGDPQDYGIVGMHHVGILCKNLERSLDFYQNVLGLEINDARPDNKLPYRGAWLWVGSEMIHLMELPNPDPLSGRPNHGGRDRHSCVAIKDVSKLKSILDKAGIPYTLSRSGRPAIFFRDPDANALEFAQFDD